MGTVAATAKAMTATSARAELRHRITAAANISGSAAMRRSAIPARVISASPPARPATTASEIEGRSRKRAPASNMSAKKNRNSVSVRIWLLKTISVGEMAARAPAIRPVSGDKSAPSAAISVQVPASIPA